ncbi:MAG: folate-binding protein [Gammaproteobacteria bacterium]|uniref:CAF17-like 4Fe-4S cluster assembly/insertion protein YgfZ n=1 Tax=Rhodoferax sp. TaxID=50421 RepID=UPI001826D888|nr:folate-binding protein [Rhodoferax sp.]MBU3899541.1 folate-binding protein [Gammaproteobacteria bacterium]MBA3059612.1 folate-binding protein YgfZ [Rhodoferax sp.]MBU3997090.1 folate-binding protein [Gammaproteobacteria bacterium]MBU4018017.1 folate-binding protein [Gammaproteobacteria bacterium]MBU4080292.1 folate-binding protein [Gammaproteobacteria bacterium]
MNIELNGVAKLDDLGVIRAQGEEAANFLQGQLTQDFLLLTQAEARLAAFCSAKGRMQASFIGFKRSPTDILLLCSRDILAATLKRLSMFVLRAKVKLSDASDLFLLYGLAGAALKITTENIADYADGAWAKADFDAISLVNLYPTDAVARALWVAPVDTPAPKGAALTPEQWAWGEVRSGIATITEPVVEAFVPQMLNYESVGGVNFKKGCYPGQEVVARSQFRGTLKRRAYLAHCEAPLSAGDELFAPDDATQPCGMVVQAAPAPLGGFDAIVSMQISAFAAGAVHARQADGPPLTLSPAPYPLLADI